MGVALAIDKLIRTRRAASKKRMTTREDIIVNEKDALVVAARTKRQRCRCEVKNWSFVLKR